MQRNLSRRGFVGASAGLMAAAALSGRLPIGGLHTLAQEDPATPTGTGEWTFTDDKGVTVTLPKRPARIVADLNAAAPLWDFGIRPVGVFGWNATETGEFGDAGGRVDPEQVEVVGTAVETIVVEDTAALQPDLIVTVTWSPDDPKEYWSIGEDVLEQVTRIAPIVAISATGSADANLARFAELATLLGADLNAPEQKAERDRYAAALTRFEEFGASKGDLAILFAYIDDAEPVYYVANPPDWADLTLYQNLGLSLVIPDAEPGSYWQELSFEEGLAYPADVLFNSTRPGTLTAAELAEHPVFGQHPAVKAGQVARWNQDFILSHQGMADALEATIGQIEGAVKL